MFFFKSHRINNLTRRYSSPQSSERERLGRAALFEGIFGITVAGPSNEKREKTVVVRTIIKFDTS
jgi:hypothetical protein